MKSSLLFTILLTAGLSACGQAVSPDDSPLPSGQKGADITYQINVYSFADSDGDGYGDLKGITEHLDYLDGLGATALWLSPIQDCSSYHGYDVLDYSAINPKLGSEEDFKELIDKAREKNIDIYMDYVLNHSGRGEWFRSAVSSADSPYRSFFGFLAAQQLGLKGRFNHQALRQGVSLKELVGHEAVRRFLELYAMDDKDAMIEWREVSKHTSEDVALQMADWALASGNVNYAIQGVIAGRRWDALDYRFPAPYRELYQKFSSSTKVSLSFLYGISRQESMMNPVIRSPAGAVGLMQLMPETARVVSRMNKWDYRGVSDLVIPEKNIRLGSMYLRNMLDKFDGNRVLAAAAYNAGPQRVYRWASKDGLKRDTAMYVENIPFDETRKYVQNVLLYDAIYNKLLNGRDADLLSGKEMSYLY